MSIELRYASGWRRKSQWGRTYTPNSEKSGEGCPLQRGLSRGKGIHREGIGSKNRVSLFCSPHIHTYCCVTIELAEVRASKPARSQQGLRTYLLWENNDGVSCQVVKHKQTIYLQSGCVPGRIYTPYCGHKFCCGQYFPDTNFTIDRGTD